MPLAQLLAFSLLAFLIATVLLLRDGRLRKHVLRRRRIAWATLLATVLGAGSFVIRDSGASGTGVRTSHGWPKPFYFSWASWESAERVEGMNWMYFAGNVVGWLSVTILVLLAWAAIRVRRSAAGA